MTKKKKKPSDGQKSNKIWSYAKTSLVQFDSIQRITPYQSDYVKVRRTPWQKDF